MYEYTLIFRWRISYPFPLCKCLVIGLPQPLASHQPLIYVNTGRTFRVVDLALRANGQVVEESIPNSEVLLKSQMSGLGQRDSLAHRIGEMANDRSALQ